MAFCRPAAAFGLLLAAASSSFAGEGPDRSGEALLRTLFCKPAAPVHARIAREQKGAEDPSFVVEHVSEVWVDRDGRFRFELANLWGDGRLIVNDGERLVVDDLDGGPPEPQKGWNGLGPADALHGLFGSAFSALHLLAMGERAFDELVDLASDVLAQDLGGSRRAVTFQSGRLGTVRVLAESAGRGWRVVQIEVEQEGSVTRDAVRFLPFDGKGRFDTSFAPG